MVFDIATLDRVAADLGTPVPNGDPDKIFALADQIEASAHKWDGHADELARLKAQLRSALTGDTAQAHDQKLAKLLNGPDSLSGDSAAVRAGVAALRNYAADLQDNQWTSRLLAAWLLATMIWGAASIIATGGQSLVEVAVARVRTAAAINALKQILWRRIAAILTEMLINAGKGMLLGGAEQLVVQGTQVAMGERTSLNGQLIAGTGLSFAEFGVGAEAAEHSVLGLVGDAVKDSRAGSVAAWATSKVLSGMAANTVATAASGGSITPETLGVGAALGAAGGLADARGKGTTATTGAASVPEAPIENTAPRIPNDTHPTLRFERVEQRPDGTTTFAWPGETANDAGPHAHTAPAPAPTTEPARAAGEHNAGTASHALAAAADPARSVETTTTTAPATTETAHQPDTSVAASLDPSPTAHAALGSHLSEGTLDLSPASPAAHTGPLTATASPTLSLSPPPSNAVSPATPTMPNAAPPAPTPTVPTATGPSATAPTSPPASPGPTAGPSSPTPAPHPGPAEISPAGKSSSEAAAAPTAGRLDTTATHTEPGIHDTPAEHAASAQAAAGVGRAAPAGRPEAGSHALSREDSAAADRQQRPADPLGKREDSSTRPAGDRHHPSTSPRGRPRKLHGAVSRDIPKDLQPAAATRAPDTLAAAEDIGVIKASHDDNGPGPSRPEAHQGGRDSSDGHHNTPNPDTDTADGGAGGRSNGGGGAGIWGPDDPGGDGDVHPSDGYGHEHLLGELRRRYEEDGLSIKNLADIYNLPSSRVRDMLHEAGTEMRPPGGRAKPPGLREQMGDEAYEHLLGELRRRYEEGELSIKNLAAIYNLPDKLVGDMLHEAGTEMRPPGGRAKPPGLREQMGDEAYEQLLGELRTAYDRGLSVKKLAAATNLPPAWVRDMLHEAGTEMRPPGGHARPHGLREQMTDEAYDRLRSFYRSITASTDTAHPPRDGSDAPRQGDHQSNSARSAEEYPRVPAGVSAYPDRCLTSEGADSVYHFLEAKLQRFYNGLKQRIPPEKTAELVVDRQREYLAFVKKVGPADWRAIGHITDETFEQRAARFRETSRGNEVYRRIIDEALHDHIRATKRFDWRYSDELPPEPTIIEFDPALLELVDMGNKTTTIRAGHRNYQAGPAVLRFGADTQRDASIVGIRHTALDALTVHDARTEGYATTEELVAVLRHYYPGLADTAALTIVEFGRRGTDDPSQGEPESHDAGNDGSDGHNAPDPGAAGGGAGDYRGGDGGHRGGMGGGGESDDESHPVERYFETHPPSGDVSENAQPGDDLHRVAGVLTEIYGREIHLQPGGPIIARRLFSAAGTDLAFVSSYAEVGDTLRYVGRDSSAIVTLSRIDESDVVICLAVNLAVNIRGQVHYHDPALGVLISWPPPGDEDPEALIDVGYFGARGDPLLPLGEAVHCRLTADSWEQLDLVEGSASAHEIEALNAGFAAAMNEGAVPGSARANALAEEHLAYVRRVIDDYGYESHRADGRLLVTEARFRDPLERIAPGLARYVRDVIVANTEHRLGPLDDPLAPDQQSPGQPGALSGLEAGEHPQSPLVEGDDSGLEGSGEDRPGNLGRDGASHLVERYFQTHSPSGDAIENRRPGDDVRGVVEVVSQIYGREIHLRSAGPVTMRELFDAAGSDWTLATYTEVEDTLRYLRCDSLAIVWAPGSDESGDDVFLAVNLGEEIYYYDPVSEVRTGWPPPWNHDQDWYPTVVYFDAHGDPVLPPGDLGHCRLTMQNLVDEAWAGLPEADRPELAHDMEALNAGFASAMEDGVAPGSERANALAEQHLAYARRLFPEDYGYESHRADGRQLVTEGEFRDPLEWIAPGLARYVRDVIVANAERHLGP